jgi:uncharacterized membrane protein
MGQIQIMNGYYFSYIFIAIAITLLSVKFLKNKSDKYRYWFIFSLIMINFIIHFLKVFIYPYTLVDHVWTKVTFENVSATTVLLFPLLFFVKNKTLKDYMVMVGMAAGILTFVAPLDTMSTIFNGSIEIGPRSAYMLENIRFYFAHYIMFLVPFLMMHFKMHELSIKRAYRAPFMLLLILVLILINEVILTIINVLPKEHLFDPTKRNPSVIFGPKEQFSGLGIMIGIFVPSFMMLTHPIYEFTFYVPVLWLIIPVMIYGGLISLTFCFIYDKEETKLFFKHIFSPKSITQEEKQNI